MYFFGAQFFFFAGGSSQSLFSPSAPNAYSVSSPKDQPSYSLSSRHKEPKKYITPAPGAYEAADTNGYKPKAPTYSLSTR